MQCIACSVSNISDKFTGEGITCKSVELLLDFLFDPYTPNGAFDKQYVEGEKQNLKDDIEAIINDKRSYANMRVIEEMCKGEENAVFEYPDPLYKLKLEYSSEGVYATTNNKNLELNPDICPYTLYNPLL